MEDFEFGFTKKYSDSDYIKGRILECELDLKVFGDYFGGTGLYTVTIGNSGIKHTEELLKAYENTWNYWKNNQEELLDSILEIAGEQYRNMWEEEKIYFEAEPPIYAEYDTAQRHYEQLMDKQHFKKYGKIEKIHFIPIIYNSICYVAICIIDISDYEVFRVHPIWLILEGKTLVGSELAPQDWSEINLWCFRDVEIYLETGKPILCWEREGGEEIKVPQHLGRGGNITKFKKLVPYLSNMRLEAVTKSAKQDYFLPRGAYPIGEYNGIVYFFLKEEKDKRWEDCPIFDLDSSLELEGCIPLAENLLSFLKLATLTHSFFSISMIARFSMKEYKRYKTRNHNKYDVSEEINVIENNFYLPEINDVFMYVNNLKKNKSYVKMGEKILYNMYKKRSMEEEYYDIYVKQE